MDITCPNCKHIISIYNGVCPVCNFKLEGMYYCRSCKKKMPIGQYICTKCGFMHADAGHGMAKHMEIQKDKLAAYIKHKRPNTMGVTIFRADNRTYRIIHLDNATEIITSIRERRSDNHGTKPVSYVSGVRAR